MQSSSPQSISVPDNSLYSSSTELNSSARSSAAIYRGTISSVPSANHGDRRARTRCKCSRGCVLDYLSAWTSHLQMILLIAILTVYLLVGASVFQRLESPNEHERIEHAVQNHSLLERTKAFIIGNLTNKGSISQAEALELIYVFGNISGSEAKLSLTHNWDFGPSVFFVTTVITTIGKTILTNNFSLYAVYLFMQDMVVLLRRLKKEEFS